MDKYDTLLARFVAGFIDGIVLVPVGLLSIVFNEGSPAWMISGLFITHSASMFYSIYFHWKTGSTFGKMVMGIIVVDQSETRLLTFEQSLRRDSVYIVLEFIGLFVLATHILESGVYPNDKFGVETYLDLLATGWLLLEIVTAFYNNKSRAVHDLIAGSVVIKKEFWKAGVVEHASQDAAN